MDAMVSLNNAREYLLGLPRQLERRLNDQALLELNALLARFEEFFNIADNVDQRGGDQVVDADEATEICDFGFMLLDKLIEMTARPGLSGKRAEIEQIALVIARWAIRHGATINDLEPVVSAIDRLAGPMHDQAALLALSELMTDIVEHCAPEFKQDQDNDSHVNFWQDLHVHRGKIAIRSRDPDIMKRAFDEFLLYLPHEATRFFAERMKEAEAEDYPGQVRELLAFYLASTPVRLH